MPPTHESGSPSGFAHQPSIVWDAELERLRAENERLRKALERICTHDVIRSAFRTEIAMREIARDALETNDA
jgi:hypothetical protein